MAKTKYHYNSHTLKYEKVKTSIKTQFLRVLGFLTSSFACAILLVYVGFTFIDSPREKQHLREINQLTLQYDIMQKRMEQMDAALEEIELRDEHYNRVN